MPLKETAAQLRQERAGLVNEARTILEKSATDKVELTVDQRNRVDHILGTDAAPGGEAQRLAERISQVERIIAIDGKPFEKEGDRRSAPLPHEDPANTGTRHSYSLLKAAKCRFQGRPVDGLEGEVHAELVKRTSKDPVGFLMPYSTRGALSDAERRALDSGAGAGAIPTVHGKDWIELLRNAMVMDRAGMRQIMNLEGRFAIPRQNAAATAYWVGESTAVTGSNQTLDQIVFTPKTIGAYTDISRRYFELQNMADPEAFVKEDLTAVLGRGVDLAALNGSGSSSQPLGIMQNPAITATRTLALGTNGAAPTWAGLVNLYTFVARSNAGPLGEFVYLSNANMEGTLATTVKVSSYPQFLLDDNGKVYGKRFLSSEQVPSNLTKGSGTSLCAIVGGIFNQLVAAYWSGVDILVDPYTGSNSGTVRIVALQDMDVQVRHNEAFGLVLDAISNQS
jgi:HK97 family phage major capsid protein